MNSLLEEALLLTGHVDNAAIIRIKDGAVKGKSPHFAMHPLDWLSIQHAFERPRETRILDAGVTLSDTGYRVVRADTMAVYGKNNNNTTAAGIIICRTHQYYILGTYVPGMYASIAVEAVEKLEQGDDEDVQMRRVQTVET
ncbi:Profilin-4 [Geranomyces michiganensis]|nr:Profilin-4 [Geranomyces michiganensis]